MTSAPFSRDVRSDSERAPRLLTWVSLALLILAVPLAINLVRSTGVERTNLAEVQRMRNEVQQAQTRRNEVKDALVFARTDAFTDYYARAYLRWAKAGETVVVPTDAQPAGSWLEKFVGKK